MSVARIDPFALKARFDAGEPLVLLDVREAFERDIATISVPITVVEIAIPMREITSRIDELTSLANGRTVVVYCHHGQRSMVAARWLDATRLADVANLEGGIDLWTARIDPSTPSY